MVKNSPCNTGDADSIPGRGVKVLLASDQLSQRATNIEACLPQLESCVLQRKISHDATKTRLGQINK